MKVIFVLHQTQKWSQQIKFLRPETIKLPEEKLDGIALGDEFLTVKQKHQ